MVNQSNPTRSEKDIEVLAVHGIDVDWLLKMPKLPSYDEKLTAEYLGKFAGGPVGNFACLASFFGVKVSAACTLGKDEGGEILYEDFLKYGVDVRFIVRDKKFITPFVIVVVDPTGEKAVIIPRLKENQPAEISDEALERSEFIYMLAADYKQTLSIAKRAKGLGAKVVLDIEPSETLSQELLIEMLRYCDIASFNEQGFSSRFGKPLSIEEAETILSLGPDVLLITRGKGGALAINENGLVEVQGYPVDARDTTGAGDTFNAAFMSRYIKGDNLGKCLRFANAAAAILIQTIGTRTHIPTVEEITQFIENQRH